MDLHSQKQKFIAKSEAEAKHHSNPANRYS
jgi:hypothetical protein